MPGPYADKEIVLGITGSIAAYKACELASRLVEGGATVRAVLTGAAQEFVGAASLEGITGNPAITSMFGQATNPEIEHIAVARWADLFLLAPASANLIAKAAQGIADDWLTTSLLATRAPLLFAPAMNMHMYAHPATQANIATLTERGAHFVGPDSGALACGDVGPGRLIDPAAILERVRVLLNPVHPLAGKRVLITSGANHEPVDPVRFIGNRSSGKMGRALALEALRQGAEVTVVTGPHEAPLPRDAQSIHVETAAEMLEAVEARWNDTDIFIAAAAVADYRVDRPMAEKHKRDGSVLTLTLVPNPDIARHVGLKKRADQISVGFAAETHDAVRNATDKLSRKNFDLVVANEVGVAESGFGTDTNKAWLVAPGMEAEELPLMTKDALAVRIFARILTAVTASPDPSPVHGASR